MKKIIVPIIIALILSNSCSVGYEVSKTFTPLRTLNCDTISTKIDLYFDGEKIDFEYEKIGLIEIQGNYSSKDAELIEEVKKIASSKCCDAVINLKKSYIDRDEKLLFTDVPDKKYTSIVFNGIAVRKLKDK
ncbi:hypothetical protein [Flavobacterium okayamense]|uniref:Lipoprotein n=1 Tax=Flavobacterium okayamense TaxID=2830782 RepID=A0ABM7S6H6_9FLAO|nr:hypothetical protein [Flavobacterium okayamense]BCY28271.1 hypothetical protein KK2020170_11390 [Flavobacterium okayamense]